MHRANDSLGKIMGVLSGEYPGLKNVFNPWRDYDHEFDIHPAAPLIRLGNLKEYLACRLGRAKVALIAEAPGYRGAKFSGLAMTSERALLQSASDLLDQDRIFPGEKHRTSDPSKMGSPAGMIEPTASIVWNTMTCLGFHPWEFVLWNAFPYHPFKEGDRLTNRKPTEAEIEYCKPVLLSMLDLFPGISVVAVGNVSRDTLLRLGIAAESCVRHPANGGATEFRAGMAAWQKKHKL